jgi:MFS family permease
MLSLAHAFGSWQLVWFEFYRKQISASWLLQHEDEQQVLTVRALGGLVGSFVFGWACDKFGRRSILRLTLIATSSLGIASAMAPNVRFLLLCRFGVALAAGGLRLVAFVLLIEQLGPRHRLLGASLFFATHCVMILVLSFTSMLTQQLNGPELLAFSVAPIILLAMIGHHITESPRWLHVVGRTDEAAKALEAFAHSAQSTQPELANLETQFGVGSCFALSAKNMWAVTIALIGFFITQEYSYRGVLLKPFSGQNREYSEAGYSAAIQLFSE